MRPIFAIAQDLENGVATSRQLTEEALDKIEDPNGEGSRTFIRVFRDAALAAADASDRLRAAGVVPSPIAGIPVSVKDLCDIAGVTTYAGSVTRNNEPPAQVDAPVVARLRSAGAVVMGTTNLTEFACGGLGLNPHFGDCLNPYDRETGRIPGGSSSGAAVSVTDGMAAAGLGTDTAGSVRIPAAFCGLTGFKPTKSRIPTDGIFPLSTTLDSVGPLAPTVACCALVDAVFANEVPNCPVPVPLDGLRFGIPDTLVMDDLEPTVSDAFHQSVQKLSDAGVRTLTFPFEELAELGGMGRTRFPAMVEGYSIHRDRLEHSQGQMDPRITERFLGGAQLSGADYYEILEFRKGFMSRAALLTGAFDAVIMPTLPITAPPIAQFYGNDERLRDPHIIIIRNTCVANLLDRCALTIPCHAPGTPPVGFTLMGENMADRRILGIGLSVEKLLSPNL